MAPEDQCLSQALTSVAHGVALRYCCDDEDARRPDGGQSESFDSTPSAITPSHTTAALIHVVTMMLHVPLRQSVVLLQSSTQYTRSFSFLRYVCSGKGRIALTECRQKSVRDARMPMRANSQRMVRFFSSTSPSSSEKSPPSPDESEEEPIIWLYKRTPDRMVKPRVILGLATFHTFYWTWYVADFMPAVNQSPLEHLHIDPVVGYVGMFFSVFVNMGAALYPWSLVSGIGIRGKGELCVFSHSLPTMTPATKGVVYEIGDVCMDPSTEETKKVVETLEGDISSYRGSVALKAARRRLPYLLQIEDSNEVLDPWMMLQVLVNPELAKKEVQRSSDGGKPKRSGKRAKNAQSRKRGRRR